MNHRTLVRFVAVFLILLTLFCLAARARAQGVGEMFVSPRVQETNTWGTQYTVWAAIRTPGDRDSVDILVSLDPRSKLTGAQVTYTLNGGGACGYASDENHLACQARAEGGWVGLTLTFKLTNDKAALAQGRELYHTITVCGETGCVEGLSTLILPPPDLPLDLRQYLPLMGGA
jgi:hypothetical protein